MDRQMDGCMNGWEYKWLHMNEWIDGSINIWLNGKMNKCMVGWRNRWMITNEWMN